MALLRSRPAVPQPGAAVPRVVPIATNFDFLEGAFVRAEKGRRTSLGAAMVALIVMSALVLVGVSAVVQTRTARSTIETANAADMTVVAEIAVMDQADGISAGQLRAHTSDRQAALKAAVTAETDMAALLAAVHASLPSGVVLETVEYTGVPPTPRAGKSGSSVVKDASGTKDASPEKAVPTPGAEATSSSSATKQAGAGTRSLRVVGMASDFSQIGMWSAALGRIEGVTNVTPTWTGGGDTLKVTLTAGLSDAANSQRAKDVETADQYGFANGSGN